MNQKFFYQWVANGRRHQTPPMLKEEAMALFAEQKKAYPNEKHSLGLAR